MPCYRFDQQTGCFHFQDGPLPAYFGDIRMGECMIADLMAFPVNSFYDGNIIFRIDTHQKKSGRHIFPAENIQYLWSIHRIGTVIKSKYQFFLIFCSIFPGKPFGWKLSYISSEISNSAVSSSGIIFPLVGPPITSSTSPSPE